MKLGVALGTHATRGPHGLDQLDVLQQEGVDLRRVVVAHSGSYPRHKYHAEIARRGAYISFDRMGTLKTANEYERQRTLRLIKRIIEEGLIDNLVFSHDVCYNTDYTAYGGGGYEFLSRLGLSLLGEEIGLTAEQFKTIMVDNPRRLLAGSGSQQGNSTRIRDGRSSANRRRPHCRNRKRDRKAVDPTQDSK